MTHDEENVKRRGATLEGYWQEALSLPGVIDHPALHGIVGFDRASLCAPGTPAAARLLAGGYAEVRLWMNCGELSRIQIPGNFWLKDWRVLSSSRGSCGAP